MSLSDVSPNPKVESEAESAASGAAAKAAAAASTSEAKLTLYGGSNGVGRRITVRDLALAKQRGEHWPMLTAYDALTAGVFDEAGIPVLLVGDSAADNHLGYSNTVPVTVDELITLTSAVVRAPSGH